MKNKIFVLLFLLCNLCFAQREWEKWNKSVDPYIIEQTAEKRNYKFEGESAGSFLVNSSISLYWFFISDQDGDNCPFYPSCSHFFIASVRETNLLQGALMFSDRFTRDMNIFDRKKKYPFIKNKRLYDPPGMYTLENIKYPPSE